MAGFNVLGRLMDWTSEGHGIRNRKDRQRVGCQRPRRLVLREGTAVDRASGTGNTSKLHPTYQTNTLPKNCACGKRVENVDYSPEGSREFAISASKFCQLPSLVLENVHDRVDGMTILELFGERMIDQLQPCLFLIVLQGSVEEQLNLKART